MLDIVRKSLSQNRYPKIANFAFWVFIILLTVNSKRVTAACCNDIGSPSSFSLFSEGIAYSPDGTCFVASDTNNNQVNIYGVTPGVCGISNTTPIHQIAITDPRGVAFSQDGNCLAITSPPNDVFIYSMNGCTPSSSPIATITYSNPTFVSFSSNCLAVASNSTVSLYSMNNNCMPSASPIDSLTLSGIGDVKFSPDGACLAIGFSSQFRLYNIANCTFGSFTTTSNSQIAALAFSPSGLCLAVSREDFLSGNSFNFYSINSCIANASFTFGSLLYYFQMAFSPDGSCLAGAGFGPVIDFYPINVPIVNITPVSTTVCEGGTITFTATSGFTSYSWTGPNGHTSTTNTITVSNAQLADAGDYVVTVTGSNGCQSIATATATVNPNPTVAISGNTSFCAGGSTTLTANPTGGTAPYTYLWNTGATTQAITVTTAGTYSVTVTDSLGCTGSANVNVTISNPTVTISGNTSFCSGGSTTLTANPTGGTSPYTYLWNTGATTQSITVTTAGDYSVTVTDSLGCIGSANVNVTISNPTVTISGNTSFCAGGSTTLTANPTGGTAPYTYLWNTGATTQSITVTTAGDYSVTVTDSLGCIGSANVNVTISNPTVTISGNTSFCAGGSTTLTANSTGGTSPYTFLWSTGETTQSITVTTAGTYSVIVTDSNGCTGSANVNVTVNTNPTVTISGNTSFCAGGTTTLTANPTGGTAPYTLLWSTGATTQSITVTTAGTYSVIVTDSNGCTGSANVNVTVNTNPTVTISGNTSFCAGGTTTLTANPTGGTAPYTLLWSTGEATQSITVTTAGTYSVTVTDSNGCTGSANVNVIVNANPIVNVFPSDQTIAQGQTLTIQSNPTGGTLSYTFVWQRDGQTLPDQISAVLNIPNAQTTDSGIYTVTVTDANGCTVTGQAEAIVQPVIPFEVIIVPSLETVFQGQTIVLKAEIISQRITRQPFTYRWFHDGILLPDQTSSTLTIPNAQLSDAGIYTVEVTGDGFTGTASATVTVIAVETLIVNVVPSILEICQGCDFTLTAEITGGVAPYTFVWRGPNNFRSTEQSITITNASINNMGQYRVVVTDSLGNIATNSSTVTVNTCSMISKAIRSKYCNRC